MENQETPSMETEDQGRALMNVVARAMSDESFRASLKSDPVAILKAEGVDVPLDMKITVLQASATETFIVLPDPAAVNDELLATAAGGSTAGSLGSAGATAACVMACEACTPQPVRITLGW